MGSSLWDRQSERVGVLVSGRLRLVCARISIIISSNSSSNILSSYY